MTRCKSLVAAGGVALLLLAGCAGMGTPEGALQRKAGTWTRLVAARGCDPLSTPDPFAVTAEMVAWAKAIAGSKPREAKLPALQDALLDRQTWAFEYDADRTFTATEAFTSRRGNCVSYANLFVALGRTLGIPLRAALLARRPSSGREGDLVLVYNHVVAVKVDGPVGTVYDFGSVREGDVRLLAVMEDLAVAALAVSNRGIEAFRRNELGAARTDLEAALRLGPGLALLYANLGLVQHRQGNVAEALSTYRRGLEVSQHDPSILQNLAACYESEGRHAEARAALAAVDTGMASPHALIVLGDLALSERNVKAALGYYRNAARLAPASVDPLVGIAKAERSRGGESAARKALEKALKLEPDNAVLRALLAAPAPRS